MLTLTQHLVDQGSRCHQEGPVCQCQLADIVEVVTEIVDVTVTRPEVVDRKEMQQLSDWLRYTYRSNNTLDRIS